MKIDDLKMLIRSGERWNKAALVHIGRLTKGQRPDMAQAIDRLLTEWEGSELSEGSQWRANAKRDGDRQAQIIYRFRLHIPESVHGMALMVCITKGYMAALEEAMEEWREQVKAMEALADSKREK